MIARLATLISERAKAQLEPMTDAGIEFVGGEEGVELLSSATKELGAVVSKGISVEKSIIKTSGSLYLIHQAHSFRVILMDKKGNKASRDILDKNLKTFAVDVIGPTQENVQHLTFFFFFLLLSIDMVYLFIEFFLFLIHRSPLKRQGGKKVKCLCRSHSHKLASTKCR